MSRFRRYEVMMMMESKIDGGQKEKSETAGWTSVVFGS
jgi:hypothetical protein